MIDTDKYEGHTVNRRDKLGTFKGTDIFVWDWFAQQLPVWASKADAQLIADAPLLLEEVKRLREKCVMLDVIINKMQGTTVFDNAVYETHKHFHLSNECLDVCLVCMEMIE